MAGQTKILLKLKITKVFRNFFLFLFFFINLILKFYLFLALGKSFENFGLILLHFCLINLYFYVEIFNGVSRLINLIFQFVGLGRNFWNVFLAWPDFLKNYKKSNFSNIGKSFCIFHPIFFLRQMWWISGIIKVFVAGLFSSNCCSNRWENLLKKCCADKTLNQYLSFSFSL